MILLRTALLKNGKTYVQAGGDDSELEAEFQETVNKSKAIHPPQWHCYGGRVLKAVALAETFAKSP